MNIYSSLILGFIALFASLSTAQDDQKLKADEILMYFPLGKYDTIIHEETALIERSENRKLYESEAWQMYRSRRKILLPAEMKSAMESFTFGRQIRIKVYKVIDGSKPGTEKRRTTRLTSRSGYEAKSKGINLWVFRVPNLCSLIVDSIKSSSLSETEYSFHDKPVLTVFSKNKNDSKASAYLFVSQDQYLLACEDIKILRRMVDVGLGVEQGILIDEDMKAFETMIPELGMTWIWTSNKSISDAISGERYSNGEISLAEKNNPEKSLYPVTAIETYDTYSPFTIRNRMEYGSGEVVEKYFFVIQDTRPNWPIPGFALKKAATKFTRKDNVITSTLIYDDVLLRKLEELKSTVY